ncbi:MAG: ABC transporter permease [Bacteroidales bacterium]|nr:ABC transporter permease [Bacteroidales bacterium]
MTKRGNFKAALFVAWRHLFSKKKHNIVNIISIISVIGVMAGTVALIVILSVFNGMEDLVVHSFNSFNPDIKITLQEGKSFEIDSFPTDKIAQIPTVVAVEEVVSDLVLMEYDNKQQLIELKGVSETYAAHSGFDTLLIDGTFALTDTADECVIEYGVMGEIAAGIVQLNLKGDQMVKLYYPKRLRKNLGNPANAFNKQYLSVAGVFSSQTEYDSKYLLCSMDFARELMNYENEVTSIEVYVSDNQNIGTTQKEIQAILGDQFVVKNHYQQEELLFKTMKTEKVIIFTILAFILFIAAFNIIGTLGMIIIEKKEDITLLHFLGATPGFIQRIFMIEGMMISFIGGIIGMILGVIICGIQQTFHIITLGDNYIIDYYPIKMMGHDFIIIFITIILTSLIVSYLPIRYLKLKNRI